MKVMLETGLMFGEERQLEVTLRELTTGDLLDAETAAERLVMTAEGEPVLVKSTDQSHCVNCVHSPLKI